MREILFKAKRKDNGEWVEGFYAEMGYGDDVKYYIIQNVSLQKDISYFEDIEIDPDTLCQFTGLCDKNGNRIWENDIVELVGTYSPFVCKWDEYIARFIFDNDFSSSDFNCYRNSEIEVIGNTFDGGLNDGKETEEN